MRTTLKATAALIAVALVLVLAACGGSGSGTSIAQPPAAAQIAAQIGATGVQPLTPPTMYAYDEANATLHGRSVDIATFRTDELRDKWVQIASQFGGIAQTGHLYAVADG